MTSLPKKCDVTRILPIEFGEPETGGKDNVFMLEMKGGSNPIYLAAISDLEMGLWVR